MSEISKENRRCAHKGAPLKLDGKDDVRTHILKLTIAGNAIQIPPNTSKIQV
jgi:hypothetical protein